MERAQEWHSASQIPWFDIAVLAGKFDRDMQYQVLPSEDAGAAPAANQITIQRTRIAAASDLAKDPDLVWFAPHPNGSAATPSEVQDLIDLRRQQIRAVVRSARKQSRATISAYRLKLVQMKRQSVRRVFAPILDLLVAKSLQLEKAQSAAQKYREWVAEGAAPIDPNATEGHDVAEDWRRGHEAAEALRQALYGKPVDQPHLAHLSQAQRDDMDRAADYADEWYTIPGNTGPIALRIFYSCNRKHYLNPFSSLLIG